ncbi:hypothetical protein ACJJTC_007344 [Scirpophaga incertulas]
MISDDAIGNIEKSRGARGYLTLFIVRSQPKQFGAPVNQRRSRRHTSICLRSTLVMSGAIRGAAGLCSREIRNTEPSYEPGQHRSCLGVSGFFGHYTSEGERTALCKGGR